MYSRLKQELFTEAWARGVVLREIARELGVPLRTLARWRVELELPARPRGFKRGYRKEEREVNNA